MRPRTLGAVLGGLLLSFTLASAETTEVDRSVGSDGVPVITIKGQKPAPSSQVLRSPQEIEPRAKAFRVYDLDGQEPETRDQPVVIVVGSPPPIAPNPDYGNYGYYGWGQPYRTPYRARPRHHKNRPAPYNGGGGYYAGVGSRGYYHNSGYGRTVGQYLNYQSPPINYQSPPINYQSPPINYQFNGYRGYGGFRGGFRGGYRGGICR